MDGEIKERYLRAREAILDRFFQRMNPCQREAVYATEGPVLIIAEAGSGKTTVVVNRIANMVRFGDACSSDALPPALTGRDVDFLEACLRGTAPIPEKAYALIQGRTVAPQNILAITFTNKAAGELRERLSSMLGKKGANVVASTFHSLCARILRQEIDRIGLRKDFTIYAAEDSVRVMKEVLGVMGLDPKLFDPRQVLSAISRAKDKLASPSDFYAAAGEDDRLLKYAEAYRLYQEQLVLSNALDFDDLIVYTVALFRRCPKVLETYQERYHYIMVDEYQDTNMAQFELVRLLAGKYHNICVVGDDDQSIYKFRGATVQNILQFEDNFPGARVFRLEQNYRSTSTILDAANAVIANNRTRRCKTLWTDNGQGVKIHVYQAEDELDESRYICEEIRRRVAAGDKYSDFVILYRMNAQSQVLERGMMEAHIPYRIVGGMRFYDRKEVKDMLAYLHLLVNPDDNLRLQRIINTPRRGIGGVTTEQITKIAQRERLSMFAVMERAGDFPELKAKAGRLLNFTGMMRTFMKRVDQGSLGDLLMDLAGESGYLKMLKEDKQEGLSRLDNLEELKSALVRYESAADTPTLSGILEDIALYSDREPGEEQTERVTLMTIHAAKGLEFDTVFIAGMEQNLFPHARSLGDPEDLEEERRLAYVAITRAKRVLHLIHAETRMLAGRCFIGEPSQFIEEIPNAFRDFTLNQAAQRAREASTFDQYTVAGTNNTLFVPGDRVRSQAFGEGWVIAAEPFNGDWMATILFDRYGQKQIACALARLERI